MTMHLSNKKKPMLGFTLVELLVVIGIIAVLVSILLPSLGRARDSAKRTACASLMRQAVLATRMYCGDNHDYLPQMNGDDGTQTYNLAASNSLQANSVEWGLYGVTRQAGTAMDPSVANSAINTNDGASVGKLVRTKYMKGDLLTFSRCPSAVAWDPSTTTAQFGFYGYNANLCRRGANTQTWWKKLGHYGKNPTTPIPAFHAYSGVADPAHLFPPMIYPLMTDPLMAPTPPSGASSLGYSTHLVKNSRAYNVAGADGSVTLAVIPSTKQRGGGIDNFGRWYDVYGLVKEVASGLPVTSLNQNSNSTVHYWIPQDPTDR